MRHHRLPFLALVGTLGLLTAGCIQTILDTIEDAQEYYQESVVIPSGSIIATRYWKSPTVYLGFTEIEASDIPQDAKVTPFRTLVGAPPGGSPASSSPTEPDRQAAPEPATLALFTGGRIPGVSLWSDRAALLLPGVPMITGLRMVAARKDHAMAPLPGDRILIAGGLSPTGVLRSAELFTFSTRSFALTGEMLAPRAFHTATPLQDGRVLIVGGVTPIAPGDPFNVELATTEIFDPATGTFTAGPSLSAPRSGHHAVLLGDGRVLIVGGHLVKLAEVYSPATNTISPVGETAVSHGGGAVAVLQNDGRVLILGGDEFGGITPTAVVERFNPATNSFTTVGSMSIPRMHHFALLQDDGRVLIGGGRTTGGDPVDSAEFFNPANNAFTPAPDLPGDTYGQAAVYVEGWGPAAASP